MVEVGRNLLRSSSPAPAQVVPFQPAVQDRDHAALDCLQGWRLNNLSEQLVPLFDHDHSKNEFSCVLIELRLFQFVLIVSSCLWTQIQIYSFMTTSAGSKTVLLISHNVSA